jgi:hypothetical protein
MPVPSFTLDGILPPFTGEPTDGATMSPFKVTVLEFVASFALTRQRVQILEGFSVSVRGGARALVREAG